MNPDQFFAEQTLSFIKQTTALDGVKLLDVGCGEGFLSAALQKSNAYVTAIDLDEKQVESARRNGVNATVCDLHNFAGDEYDIILFSRSLHHLENLAGALDKIKSLLLPRGLLILEEFDIESIDLPGLKWYYHWLSQLQNINNPASERLNHQWISEHDAHIIPGRTMISSIAQDLNLIHLQRCPYFYRSIGKYLSPDEKGYVQIQNIFNEESELIKGGSILANGLRIVAQKWPSPE